MNPSLITTVVPFRKEHFVEVNQKIRDLSARPSVTKRLHEGEFVHFLSIVAVPEVCPSEDWPASQGEHPNTAKGRKATRCTPNDDRAHVIVEITADGSVEQATAQLVDFFGDEIAEVLETARVWKARKDETQGEQQARLIGFLLEHHCPIRAGWTWANWLRARGRRNELGQMHVGAPGMTVWRIKREAELARWIGDRLPACRRDPRWMEGSPLQRLEIIRELVWRQGSIGPVDPKWAFSAESAPCLVGDPLNHWDDSGYTVRNPQARRAFANIVHCFTWPLYAVLIAALLLLAWQWAGRPPILLCVQALAASLLVVGGAVVAYFRRGWPTRIAGMAVIAAAVAWLIRVSHQSPEAVDFVLLALPKSFMVILGIVIAVAYLLYRRLLELEQSDSVESSVPPKEQIKALLSQENRDGRVQNHMATVSRLKPGLLRQLTLRLAFVVVGTGHYVGRPGFLGKNGVIHVARWLRLPGTSLLMFWSNFDGTWESYVADFIADAPTGVTAIWSNCVGFPRTKQLFTEGAEDRDQLVNWARRQQQPTLFWYSAYPELTTDRIRTNAAIRQGLASASSDADARDWLSLFGSSWRPAESLDSTEIQTLVFGALSSRRAACMLLVRFNSDHEARQWVTKVEREVTFGEALPDEPACVLGLAASALDRLGLDKKTLGTFPVAFQQGMWPEWRARALGDMQDNAPQNWKWGNEDRQPDAVVVVYGYTPQPLGHKSWRQVVDTVKTGCVVLEQIELDPVSLSTASTNGSFGFADGISQPVIRGAPRTDGNAVPTDIVAPGELVLGYPDNTKRLPPSPAIEATYDPEHYLPNAGTDPDRRRPEFSRYEPTTGQRDLGANGTFFVVRQLEQDDVAFDNWCRRTYEKMHDKVDIDFDATGPDVSRLMASLLVGRWPNGSSLVRNPRSPATSTSGPVQPDNAFRYGLEDPRGFACPFGAHTRRANPRDTRFHTDLAESNTEIDAVNRHRILRVGRAYGNTTKTASGGRGLMFMCLNADIERQFEFVQKTWLLNPNIHGLQDEIDPLVGRGPKRTFTVPTAAGPVTLDLVDFVKVVGGGYFFLPGRATLRYLARGGPMLSGSGGDDAALASNPPPTTKSSAEEGLTLVK